MALSLCQGAFGLLGGPGSAVDEDVLALREMVDAVRPGGRVVVSAFSAYFQVRYLEDPSSFDAGRGVQHEHTEVRDPAGQAAPVELWTTCFTPRELRLMVAAAGAQRRRALVGRARPVRADVTWPGPRGVPGDRHEARWYPLRALSDSAARVRAPVSRQRNHPSHFQPTQARPESESVSDQQTPVPSEPVSTDPAPAAAPSGGAATDASDEAGAPARRARPVHPAPSARTACTPRDRWWPTTSGSRSTRRSHRRWCEVEDGQIVEVTVVKVDQDEVLLDIGYKSEGVIPSRELSIRNDVDPPEIVSLGDRPRGARPPEGGQRGPPGPVEEAGAVRAGLGQRSRRSRKTTASSTARSSRSSRAASSSTSACAASCPASLVELRRVRDLQPYVGRSLEAKIIELDKNRNNVVLSRRAWLEETQKEQREDFLDNLKPGEVRKGVVSSVVNFGAFVDLGGMDGLVHVSELSWKHVDHPGSVVQVGDEITVQVLEVDLDRERISLSLKATQQDPWQEFATTHRVGELVYGRVTKLVPFGAFVQVGDGIEGLVHISEMSAHHVDLPEQVVTPGEELWVKIIDLDLQRRRISLSIKQAAEGGEVAEEYHEHFGEHAYDERGQLHRHSDHRGRRRSRSCLGGVLRRVRRGPRRQPQRPPDDQQDADVAERPSKSSVEVEESE